MRVCKHCGAKEGEVKWVTKHGRPEGLTCQACAREKLKAWQHANLEKSRAYTKTYREANPEKAKAASKAWREANPEKLKEVQVASSKKWYLANTERAKANSKTWHTANKERVSERSKAWQRANREKVNTNYRAWYAANPEKARAASQKWCRAHPEKCAANTRARKAAKLNRTPEWASMLEILEYYKEAARLTREMGIQYAVDHIVPLQGRNVSGLHVANNLQVITASENSSKGNWYAQP